MLKRTPGQMNQQIPLSIQLNVDATLNDFCWNGNMLLKQQLLSTLFQNGERMLYLWGTSGCGKSHLLQACCQALSEHSAIYLPLAILKEWGPEIIEGLDDKDFIAIDDLNAVSGCPIWEEAIFHLYNRVRDNEHTILILSGLHPPSQSSVQLPDLRSRLSWGLVFQIQELSDEDKIHTLQALAGKRGFNLTTVVGQFLLNRCGRNMHDLNRLLDRLDEASLIAQRKITIPFVKKTLSI